jgi:hypothetical protein
MATDLDLLKPYKSLILGKLAKERDLDSLVDEILTEISGLMYLDMAKSALVSRKTELRSDVVPSGELTAGFLHYSEERTASWTSDPEIKDRLNHLVLVCGRNRLIAILITDPAWKRPILQRFQGDVKALGLAALKPIASGILNAAFVQGPARTLWLTGTHRRTSVKADNKVLSGISLEDALDPLDDQTFYFSAARCTPKLGASPPKPIGVVPRSSRVWAGTSKDWPDCRDAITLLLAHLEGVQQPEEAPLPVLAISTSGVAGVNDAFDVSLQPPEALAELSGSNRVEMEDLERFGYGTHFRVVKSEGPHFEAEAWLDGKRLGRMGFKVNLARPDQVTWEVSNKTKNKGGEDFARLLELCRRRDWLKVRYDSGHTLSDGAIFKVRHRHFPFQDFDWVDLKGFELWEEKPYRLEKAGKGKTQKKIFFPDEVGKQKSLFCWVQRFWPSLKQDSSGGGWLACNDGSMEIADFIHLDLNGSAGRPALTLIHVKGAGSDQANRGISVSNYEVVTGQAVKNLRHLDRLILEEGLDKGLGAKIRKLVWRDRAASTRAEMLDVLSGIGTNYDRRVVILQPHLTRDRYEAARANPKDKDFARLQQLDTLLLSARASCNALGASFRVVADGTAAGPQRGQKRTVTV